MSFATRSSFGTFTLTPCRFCRRTSNNIIQKGLAFGRDWSGSVVNSERVRTLRDPAPPAGWPWWGFGGAVRHHAAMNRTEDLNVKVCEKATNCIIDNAV